MILPLEAHGVKVISMGFFVPEDTPVIWRGPMLHKAIEQFLGDVYWGDLDFLLCDLPPGTGDVSISLASFIPGASMVVVTTPQDAAHTVAQRAGKMAERTNLRPIGVIENMSWFICPHCGERELLVRRGRRPAGRPTRSACRCMAQVPLVPALRVGGDTGVPIVVSEPSVAGSRGAARGRRRGSQGRDDEDRQAPHRDGTLSAGGALGVGSAARLRRASSDRRPRRRRRPGPLRHREVSPGSRRRPARPSAPSTASRSAGRTACRSAGSPPAAGSTRSRSRTRAPRAPRGAAAS